MLWIEIDRTRKTPLINQIYNQIRIHILKGELQAGERLPSTRDLALNLNVSRNVILESYEQLEAEGYIESRRGAGTFVADGAFLENITEDKPFLWDTEISTNPETDVIDFRSGIPALDLFPRKTWGKLAKLVCTETPHSVFGYGHPEGRKELIHVLTKYLSKTRGVNCEPYQIVITSGATQALSLVAKLFLSENDTVVIEDPVTHEIQTIFATSGASLHPVPVDEHGIKTDLLPTHLKPKFIFVTPSHQFPLGGTLPIQRRVQLIQYARKTGSFIVEDDYDSEFRYEGAPISSLQGLDPDRVVYIGTFSKILSPALRLGYLILPSSLIKRCRNLKWFTDLHTSSLEQLTLARFIEEKHLEHHISRMKKIYRKRRETLRKHLNQHFSNKVNITGDSTGLHLIAEFINVDFTDDLVNIILENKVKIYPVEMHTHQKGIHKNKIILGYGNLSEEEIVEGVDRLGESIF